MQTVRTPCPALAHGATDAATYAGMLRAQHPPGPCTFCAAPAAHLYCSGCVMLDNCDATPARYCGGDCQRKHWTGEGTPDEPSHKVGRCRCTPSKPMLTAPLVSVLEATI